MKESVRDEGLESHSRTLRDLLTLEIAALMEKVSIQRLPFITNELCNHGVYVYFTTRLLKLIAQSFILTSDGFNNLQC